MFKRNKKYFLLLLYPISFLLIFIARNNEGFAEWYALNVYKYISRFLNFITSLVPFSLAEAHVLLFAVVATVFVTAYVIRLIRQKGKRLKNTLSFVVSPVLLAGVILFGFTLNAGINYYRTSFAATIGLERGEYEVDELYTLCEYFAKKASLLRESVSEDENGVMMLTGGLAKASKSSVDAFEKASEKYETLISGYGQTKPVMLSKLLSHTNISGMMYPFTMEANVNIDIPHCQIPYTMTHELAHIRGYMSEDEANFISYLVLSQSDDSDLQYSAALNGFSHAMRQLSSIDREKYAEIYNSLSEGVVRDLVAKNEYWAQYSGTVAQAASSINDAYLKSNNQQAGVQSYSMVVDLLLALQRQGI